MKLWHSIFIWTFVILYGSLSLAILGSFVRDTAKVLRHPNRPPRHRRGVTGFVLAVLLILTLAATVYAESQKSLVNLRGDEVLVPAVVPSKTDYAFRRLISVDGRLIVFLYSDPKFGRPVDYAETYNLMGELLEVTWYQPAEGVQRARDINLGNPRANGPARILRIVQETPAPDRRSERQKPVITTE